MTAMMRPNEAEKLNFSTPTKKTILPFSIMQAGSLVYSSVIKFPPSPPLTKWTLEFAPEAAKEKNSNLN